MYDMFLYAYKMKSAGAKLLQTYLDVSQVAHQGSNIKGRSDRVIVNWGSGELPGELLKCRVLNHPELIYNVINKLTFYRLTEDACRIPEWTTRKATAKAWLNEGITVLARTKLEGSRGEGIIILAPDILDIPDAPCYTKYIPKTAEYRIHVANDRAIGQEQKIRDPNVNVTEWKIRNRENGFILVPLVYSVPPEDVITQALKAMDRSGLDYGAVDVAYVQGTNKAYTLEINTAPWLEDYSTKWYGDAIKELAT